MAAIDAISKLSPAVLEEAKEPLGRFKHKEVTYYRFRFEDLRFYFTLSGETIRCVLIVTKNSWADFKMRNNLEKTAESEVEEKLLSGNLPKK